jgi:hypothetical protein
MHSLPIPFFCLLCSVCHSHSMRLLFPIHLSCCTTSLLLHTSITSPQQQQPHHFSVPCTYSFYAPCACNVCNASTCSHRIHLLHISSALSDHHGNPSTSLAVCPRVQHHWMSCRYSLVSLAVQTLRLLFLRRAYPFCFQLQTSIPFHLSIACINNPQSIGRWLETLHLLW